MKTRAPEAGSTARPVERRHLAYLDGIRGVSILLVMVFHERVHLPGHVVDPADYIGAYGVDLFFVLSGCCLALPYLTKLDAGASAAFDVATYAVRRVLRIMPAFVAAVAILVAATWIPAIHDRIPALGATSDISLSDAISQLTFFDRRFSTINPSFWSLALEWRWYVAFPLALTLWIRSPRLVIAFAVAAVVWTQISHGASVDLGMIDAFLAGLVAADMLLARNIAPKRAAVWFFGSLALALALGPGDYFPLQVNPAWHVVAFTFIVWAGAEPRLRALLEMRWLTGIGTIAYSTYLVHEPIVRAVEAAAAPRFGDDLAMMIASAVTLASGLALAQLIELPLQRRDVVASVVASVRPRVVRWLAFAGIPENFMLATPADVARRAGDSKVVDLRARVALKAVS